MAKPEKLNIILSVNDDGPTTIEIALSHEAVCILREILGHVLIRSQEQKERVHEIHITPGSIQAQNLRSIPDWLKAHNDAIDAIDLKTHNDAADQPRCSTCGEILLEIQGGLVCPDCNFDPFPSPRSHYA